MDEYDSYANSDFDMPITTLSTQESGTNYFLNSYPKPAMGYLYVMDYLGYEEFTKALHYYIQQWHGKHPMPLDFFNCINTGSGKNLNWFWKKWFFDNGVPDQAISKVSNHKKQYTITISSIGTKPVPIDLMVFYSDGTTQQLHKSMACWKDGNKTVVIHLSAKTNIKKLVLGNGYDADVNNDDNVWTAR